MRIDKRRFEIGSGLRTAVSFSWWPSALLKLAYIIFISLGVFGPARAEKIPDKSYKSLSPMPILMYDKDIGFGYGGKIKFLDYLGKRESFDLILFNSSKGERWYVFTFSIPDFEIRQNRSYALSFDLKAEYDKFLKYTYYGLGPGSLKEDRTVLTHESSNLALTLGRGFSPNFVFEVTYNARWLKYSEPQEGPYQDVIEEMAARGRMFVPYLSLILRYDTSNSQIHPTRGVRFILRNDLAAKLTGSSDFAFNRSMADFRFYRTIFGAKDVLAGRALVQYVSGNEIPLFDYSALGGGETTAAMRGYPVNRFLDKGKFLVNLEYRFPVIWRFGGNLFFDAGTVWPSLNQIKLGEAVFDAGLGLRFYLADFCVRVDAGFSREGTGIYFNFGHVF